MVSFTSEAPLGKLVLIAPPSWVTGPLTLDMHVSYAFKVMEVT